MVSNPPHVQLFEPEDERSKRLKKCIVWTTMVLILAVLLGVFLSSSCQTTQQHKEVKEYTGPTVLERLHDNLRPAKIKVVPDAEVSANARSLSVVAASTQESVTVQMMVSGRGVYEATFSVEEGVQWSQLKIGRDKIAGVHFYGKRVSDTIFLVDLRFSNGSVNKDGKGFCGEIYFDWLKVKANTARQIVMYERAGETIDPPGTTYTVVAPLQGDAKHFLPARALFTRSFALASPESRRDALGALDLNGLTLPSQIVDYGPQRSTFPTVDRAAVDKRFRALTQGFRAAIKNGTSWYDTDYAQIHTPIDYIQPDGIQSGDDVGGYAIEMSQAERQSRWAVTFAMLMDRQSLEGRNIAIYDAVTGEPMSILAWTTTQHQQLLTGEQGLEFPPFFVGTYEHGYKYKQFNPGFSAPYEQQQRAWHRNNTSHLIRGYRYTKVAAELGHDPVARDNIAMTFEDARGIDWSSRPDERADDPGNYNFPSLVRCLWLVQQNPHNGSPFDRALGWYMDITAEMIRLYPNRADLRADGENLIKLTLGAADRWGITLNAWGNAGYMPAEVTGAQTFHQWIVENGLFGLDITLHGTTTTPVRQQMEMVARNICDNPDLPVRAYGTAVGPPHWIATHDHGVPLTKLVGYLEGDPAHVIHFLALTYRASRNRYFLEVANKHWHPHTTLQERWDWLKPMGWKGWGGEEEIALQELLTRK